MTETVVAVQGVWKQFRRHPSGTRTLKRALLHRRARGGDRFWALQDVNLELALGDTVGLIGANGSGKSTLLRLVGGLGKPTRGRIELRRRVSAMMTLGEAFDPLLSGRENAVTAGILAGFTRRQAVAKLDEIVAFAELEEFIDHPIRTYSDGMRMRLAFAVAMSTRPEVLIIDEVLSVGDLRFQARCFDRLEELRASGAAILFASHDEQQVRRLCDRVLWLARGRMQAFGAPDDVYAAYRDAMNAETERRSTRIGFEPMHDPGGLRMNENRFGTLEVEIAAVRLSRTAVPTGRHDDGAALTVELDLLPRAPVDGAIVGVSIHRVADGARILDVSTEGDGHRLERLSGPTTVVLSLDRLDAEPGSYRLDAGVYARDWSHVYDYHWGAYPLELTPTGSGYGPSRRWRVLEEG